MRFDPYESADGSRVALRFAGQQVPVPPQDIRARLRLPAKYAYLSLAPEVRDLYEPSLGQTAVQYVNGWAGYRVLGLAPLFIGSPRSGLSSVAAATMNEVVMRSRTLKDTSGSWCSGFYVLRLIQDARDLNRYDTYTALRDAMWKDGIVVVDDLLAANDIAGGVPFLHTLYAYRHDHNLPTITTLTATSANYWGEVQRVFGPTFVGRLKQTSEGLVARVA